VSSVRCRAGVLAASALGALLVTAAWIGGPARAVAGMEGETSAPPPSEVHERADATPSGEPGEEVSERPHIDPKSLALQLFNFAVLLFILIKFGGKAVNKALLARHQQLKVDLASAAEARAAAEGRLKVQEARLASLEKEIAAMRAGLRQEAEAEKARLIATAEDRARRIQAETAFMLEQQVKEADAQLKREVAEAAIKMAEELVRRSLDGRDQQRLVDTFVTEVATGNGDGTTAAVPLHADGAPGPRTAPRNEV
jgi:F-type H+-transporting ATPase subunit b